MQLDIRLPLGLLFSIFGLLLLVVGLATDKALYQRSLGINVNFWWGVVMLLFGLTMFVLGRRGMRRLMAHDSKAKSVSEGGQQD